MPVSSLKLLENEGGKELKRETEEEGASLREIKVGPTPFKAGAGFYMHTPRARRLCWQMKQAGAEGQSRHGGMIDGSI